MEGIEIEFIRKSDNRQMLYRSIDPEDTVESAIKAHKPYYRHRRVSVLQFETREDAESWWRGQ